MLIIRCLESQIAQSKHQIIKAHEPLRAKFDALSSVCGVGALSASVLLATAPELGTLSSNQAAQLLGVAPLNCDSGLFRGKRRIYGGRRCSPGALYGRPKRRALQSHPGSLLSTSAQSRQSSQTGFGRRHAQTHLLPQPFACPLRFADMLTVPPEPGFGRRAPNLASAAALSILIPNLNSEHTPSGTIIPPCRPSGPQITERLRKSLDPCRR
jgi:Transposase IS116/IS110/IS902 family